MVKSFIIPGKIRKISDCRLCFIVLKIVFFRNGDQVDPPVEPAKLFRVERIKAYKGCPYWEKRLLRDLGLGEDVSWMNRTNFTNLKPDIPPLLLDPP